MRNQLFTKNSLLGLLIALVLAFSVQGVCEALTLTASSDTIMVKERNDPAFEISFSVGLKSDTTAIKDDDGKLIKDGSTDGGAADARIDSQGYLVTPINGRDYRTTTITTANTSASMLVPPTPKKPDPPSDLNTDNSNQDEYADYAVFEKVSSSRSMLSLWVESFEFGACVLRPKLPVDAPRILIAMLLPSGDF